MARHYLVKRLNTNYTRSVPTRALMHAVHRILRWVGTTITLLASRRHGVPTETFWLPGPHLVRPLARMTNLNHVTRYSSAVCPTPPTHLNPRRRNVILSNENIIAEISTPTLEKLTESFGLLPCCTVHTFFKNCPCAGNERTNHPEDCPVPTAKMHSVSTEYTVKLRELVIVQTAVYHLFRYVYSEAQTRLLVCLLLLVKRHVMRSTLSTTRTSLVQCGITSICLKLQTRFALGLFAFTYSKLHATCRITNEARLIWRSTVYPICMRLLHTIRDQL